MLEELEDYGPCPCGVTEGEITLGLGLSKQVRKECFLASLVFLGGKSVKVTVSPKSKTVKSENRARTNHDYTTSLILTQPSRQD